MADTLDYEDNKFQEQKDAAALRDTWFNRVQAAYKHISGEFKSETHDYYKAYRHEFENRNESRRIDINVVYQTIKSMLPVLYFKNPKVFIKSLQEKIYKTVMAPIEMNGEVVEVPVPNPETGEPLRQEFDGPKSALILQSAINQNITKAGLKIEAKSAIEDAMLGFFGAIKCGWGNDQGVEMMNDGDGEAPPSLREDVYDDSAYAKRLPPWDVVVDPLDFNNPTWIAVRYVVPLEQLKEDTRLNYTDKLEGKAEPTGIAKDMAGSDAAKQKMVEYFEVFIKPCAKYRKGKYLMVSEEVKEGPLFDGEWPTKSKTFPVKLLYFVADPEGGLPVPLVRYFYGQQEAKNKLRNTEMEWVKRTLPSLYINTSGMTDGEKVKQQVLSGQIPRVCSGTQPAGNVFGQVKYPDLPVGFHTLDGKIDTDIARVMGMLGNVTPTTNNDQLATGLKLASRGEQIRMEELADIVSDYMGDLLRYWVDLFKEYAGPENYTLIDGETFPTRWGRDEIQGNFDLEVKPFSMSYEDPVIRRKQWVDAMNLLSAPPVQMVLKEQGYSVDMGKIVKRVLETYDERDVESFIYSDVSKPEMQVMDALKENESMMAGAFNEVSVLPEDNDKIHILIHGLIPGEVSGQHILQHQQKMQGLPPGSPGGGNPEGMPINGVAVNQDMMNAPVPNPTNQKIAINREANKA